VYENIDVSPSREPVVWSLTAANVVALAGVLGLDLDLDQAAALLVVANMVAGVIARAKVTPVNRR